MQSEPLLVRATELSREEARWLESGLLAYVEASQEKLVSKYQLEILRHLSGMARTLPMRNPRPSSLFHTESDIRLGLATFISPGIGLDAKERESILVQLLPSWLEQVEGGGEKVTGASAPLARSVVLGNVEIITATDALDVRIEACRGRISELRSSRASQFARSASYMGSKAVLAPYLVEILRDIVPDDGFVVDLMCGSGAAAGAFARRWKTIASDAQEFSRLLAIVQGGGMTEARASELADEVLRCARTNFARLPEFIHREVAVESRFLSAELGPSVLDELFDWIGRFQRVGNARSSIYTEFRDHLDMRASDIRLEPYVLFSLYYANLFFGVRQAAEIDCLRQAIDGLKSAHERQWALGALICATSSCAYSYGGHFAQPKLNVSDRRQLDVIARDLLSQRGLSISHEFHVRLTNLGRESEASAFAVDAVPGPWEDAIREIEARVGQKACCVYLDPPYTRDEYSRYYHVLETLVQYNYPRVSGKASIPAKGGANGRFASPFFTRNVGQVEGLIGEIATQCLRNGWSVLWSYSDAGLASMANVIEGIGGADSVRLFSMDYTYKAQGSHAAKKVTEYVSLFAPG